MLKIDAIRFESLNVQFLASNYLIDLNFIHMIEENISILYVKYLSKLKIFISLSFLEILLHSCILWSYISLV